MSDCVIPIDAHLVADGPYWELCSCCGDVFCLSHNKHLNECECPEIADWYIRGLDPFQQTIHWVS